MHMQLLKLICHCDFTTNSIILEIKVEPYTMYVYCKMACTVLIVSLHL